MLLTEIGRCTALDKASCCLEERVFEVEYIVRTEIQRSLKQILRVRSPGEYWATRYGFVARDGLVRWKVEELGRRARKYTVRIEMRLFCFCLVRRRREHKCAGQTEGLRAKK